MLNSHKLKVELSKSRERLQNLSGKDTLTEDEVNGNAVCDGRIQRP